jgi:hypothetical protein
MVWTTLILPFFVMYLQCINCSCLFSTLLLLITCTSNLVFVRALSIFLLFTNSRPTLMPILFIPAFNNLLYKPTYCCIRFQKSSIQNNFSPSLSRFTFQNMPQFFMFPTNQTKPIFTPQSLSVSVPRSSIILHRSSHAYFIHSCFL